MLDDIRNFITHFLKVFVFTNLSVVISFFLLVRLSPIKVPADVLLSLLGVINVFILFVALKRNNNKFTSSSYGSHGTSRFQTDSEIKKNYSQKENSFFIGSTKKENFKLGMDGIYKAFDDGLNNQFIVVGPPATHKSTAFILPNLLTTISSKQKKDIILTDPKKELYKLTKEKAVTEGYDVYVLDFIDVHRGDSLNFLDYIKTESDIRKFSHKLVKSTYSNDSKESSSFWRDNFENIVTIRIALHNYLKEQGLESSSIGIADLVDPSILDYFKKHEEVITKLGGITEAAYAGLISAVGAKETISNLLATVYSKLALFAMKDINIKLSDAQYPNRNIPIEKIGLEIDSSRYTKLTDELTVLQKTEQCILNETQKKKELLFSKYYSKIKQIIVTMGFQEHLPGNLYGIAEKLNTAKDISSFLKNYRTLFSPSLHHEVNEQLFLLQKELQQVELVEMDIHSKIKDKQHELDGVKGKPILLYILMEDDESTYHPIINLIISVLFSTMFRTARTYGGVNAALPTPVITFLEEFCTIGELPEIVSKLGSMRSRRIYPILIIQSFSQLKEVYPRSFNNILSQCDNKLILGINESESGEVIEKLLGDETIQVVSETTKNNSFNLGLDNSSSYNKSYTGKRLLNSSQIYRMNENLGLFLQKSRDPIQFYKSVYRYWEMLDE